MGSKQRYIELCKKEKTIPIYLRDFWLDAVCGEANWGVSLCERGSEVFGCHPYYALKKLGFTLLARAGLSRNWF